jgi:hypothetical protein
MDQVHPQGAQEQVPDEARRRPLLLARRLGDGARLVGADFGLGFGGGRGNAFNL